ncbi:hypothetical protein B0H13DRAFT_384485 [Mycena leptocephala]|nr:hypothetical protein B0H13DRAFT_384485 [Mycena leptocephala]
MQRELPLTHLGVPPFCPSASRSRPRSSSRLLARCWRVCKYTRRIRMRVLATHIKHAMARKIERAALLALLYLCTGAPVIVRLRLPVHPVRNARRSIPPVSGPPQDHASLGLHVHPPLALVQPLPSRRGSRAPRDWALREVREGRRVPPPLHVPCLDSYSHHHDSPQARVTPLPCISRPPSNFMDSRPRSGHASSPTVTEARLPSRFVSILSFRSPLSFRQRPGYPASITFHIRNRLFLAISLKWRGRDPSRSGGG